MEKTKALRMWILLFLLAGSTAIQADTTGGVPPVSSASAGTIPSDLLGSWHTVSVEGDLLFLILREIIVDLKQDHRFTAAVVFREGTRISMNGTFGVEGNTIVFQREDHKEHGKVIYWFQENKTVLVIYDRHFGVTVELKRMNGKS